jgi:hypothetical protein
VDAEQGHFEFDGNEAAAANLTDTVFLSQEVTLYLCHLFFNL